MAIDRDKTEAIKIRTPVYKTWDDWFRETMDFARNADVSPNVFLPAPQSVRDELPAPMPTPPWRQ